MGFGRGVGLGVGFTVGLAVGLAVAVGGTGVSVGAGVSVGGTGVSVDVSVGDGDGVSVCDGDGAAVAVVFASGTIAGSLLRPNARTAKKPPPHSSTSAAARPIHRPSGRLGAAPAAVSPAGIAAACGENACSDMPPVAAAGGATFHVAATQTRRASLPTSSVALIDVSVEPPFYQGLTIVAR
ncbi:MAG TPA: hypothetical protein PKK15_15010, partial [Kouleothrix sp.]|nr:hypothetical protein [Kouleothrix sp.]